MESDVGKWVRTCAVCRLTKPQKGLSVESRSNIYDRPFSVLFVDAIGPIFPSDEGKSYILHCMCPFTGFVWLKTVAEDTALEQAKFLAEDVFLDLAGFPMVLRSDKGASYVSDIVAALNARFGVEHAFGAAYHPEAQGPVEASHQRPNNVLKAYANKKEWGRWVKVAQWAMRCSPQPNRCGYSPYELVTGLKPQGPLDRLWKRFEVKSIDPTTYVSQLTECMQSIYETIATQIHSDAQRTMKRANDKSGEPYRFAEGDWVFHKRPPELLKDGKRAGQASNRLTPYADPTPYQIHKLAKAGTAILADASGRTEFSFSQPVHISKLIPYDLSKLEEPIDNSDLKLEVMSRHGTPLLAKLTSQTATGLVRLEFDTHKDLDGLYDLASEEYRWLA